MFEHSRQFDILKRNDQTWAHVGKRERDSCRLCYCEHFFSNWQTRKKEDDTEKVGIKREWAGRYRSTLVIPYRVTKRDVEGDLTPLTHFEHRHTHTHTHTITNETHFEEEKESRQRTSCLQQCCSSSSTLARASHRWAFKKIFRFKVAPINLPLNRKRTWLIA